MATAAAKVWQKANEAERSSDNILKSRTVKKTISASIGRTKAFHQKIEDLPPHWHNTVVDKLAQLEQAALEKQKDHDSNEHLFTMFMSVIILLNILMIGLELQSRSYFEAEHTAGVWLAGDLFFIIIYSVEIFVWAYWQRIAWFRNPWNYFDVLCVSSSVFNFAIELTDADLELSMLSLMRFLKLARLVRLAKLAKSCEQIYIVVMAWYRAMQGIAAITTILLLGLFVFAIVCTEFFGLDDELKHLELGDTTVEYAYGTVVRSMFTLFQMMTLQDFDSKTRPLVMHRWYAIIFFFAYAMIFAFGLTNMLVGLVVERTLNESSQLRSQLSKHQNVLDIGYLRDAFAIIDSEKTGQVTHEQFEDSLRNEVILDFLKHIGIDNMDTHDVFHIVDLDGNGVISETEFIKGCLKMHSRSASGFDILVTNSRIRSLDHLVRDILKRLADLHERLEYHVQSQEHVLTWKADFIAQLEARSPPTQFSRKTAAADEENNAEFGTDNVSPPAAEHVEGIMCQRIADFVRRIGITISVAEQELRKHTEGFQRVGIALTTIEQELQNHSDVAREAAKLAQNRIEQCTIDMLASIERHIEISGAACQHFADDKAPEQVGVEVPLDFLAKSPINLRDPRATPQPVSPELSINLPPAPESAMELSVLRSSFVPLSGTERISGV